MWYFVIALFVLLVVAIVYMAFDALFGKNGYGQQRIGELVVVAHRGGAGMAPENSLTCIRKGLESGADMIEIDIHLTKDGEIVVCHDKEIDRTTNGKGRIADMTLEELREYRIVDKDGNATDDVLPTLGEVLEVVDGRAGLLVEIKRGSDAEQIAKAFINEVALYQAASWVVAQSFDDAILEHLHRLGHPFPIEKLLICKIPFLPIAFDGKFVGYSYSKYDYINSFNFYYGLLPVALVEDVHSHGKKVKVWTLDAPDSAPQLPVDGVITDRPDLWMRSR